MLREQDVLAEFFVFPRVRMVRGEGCWLWDDKGQKYLDMTAGLAVMSLGHARADIAKIMHDQYMTLGHTSNLFAHEQALLLAQALKEHSFADKVWFANSGTEANEAAMKCACVVGMHRGGPSKKAVVAFKGGFHGRTLGSLSVTYEPNYRMPFQALLPEVRFASFNDMASVREVLTSDVCAVFVEPVQGEGGVTPATQQFMHQLRALCTEMGALLVMDEIQTGMGRTGTLFAYEQYGVVPDMLTLAKPIAGGLPLGALLMNQETASLCKPGYHGSTFAGGPVTCAVGRHVLGILSDPAFLKEVQHKAAVFDQGLQKIVEECPVFSLTRGMGLLRALIVADPEKNPPLSFVHKARDAGLLVSRAGKNAVRFLPPLTISEDEIAYALKTLREVALAWGG